MPKVNLTNMSRKELQSLQSDIEKALKDVEKRERAEAIKAAKKAAAKHGYSLDELTGSGKKPQKAPSPPKYAHPQNPSVTWSGRGRQPAWIKEALATVTSLEALLIK